MGRHPKGPYWSLPRGVGEWGWRGERERENVFVSWDCSEETKRKEMAALIPEELLQADRLSPEPERGEQLQQLGNEEGAIALVEAGSGKLQIAALGKKRKEAASIHKGKPKSGRVWKDPGKKRFSHMIQDKPLHTSWQHKMKIRQEKKLIKDFAQELKEQKQREREEKKQRRRDNLKRRLQNERKAEVVQVIRNPLKLKRAKKKHLRRIEKRDTLALLQNSQAQLKPAKQ